MELSLKQGESLAKLESGISREMRVSQGHLIQEAKRNKTKGRGKNLGKLFICSFLSRLHFALHFPQREGLS